MKKEKELDKKVKFKTKDTSEKKLKQDKKNKKEKKEPFLISIKKEMKKVKWTNKKDMFKYSTATLFFICFFAAFFTIANLLITLLRTVL